MTSAYGKGSAIAGFLLLFVALGSLVLGIVLSARRTHDLLFQHELERAANGLVEDFAWNNRLEEELIDERIIGFGILRQSGEVIASYGQPPERESVPAGIERGPVYDYEKQEAVVTFYRRIGLARPPGRMPRMPRMQPYGQGPDLGLVLYLKWNASDHLQEQWLYTAAAVIGPLLVGILTGLLFHLYVRNLHFRRQIAEKERFAQLGESARTLMHEIKNPLNAINIRASLLEKTAPEEIAGDAGAIREEVERLRNLAERINTFLKDPAGTKEKIAIVPQLREILQANGWNSIGLTIEAPVAEEDVRIVFDRQRFRSVIENLVTNAVESEEAGAAIAGKAGEGSDAGDVEVRVAVRKKSVMVKVLDRGVGLPENGTDQLFDPFFTTKTTGSGVGLAVSRRFMQAAGGGIELHPRQGGGTEAVLVFPRVEE